MKKIMFNDKYGLTQAVLDGRKTMTRRGIKCPHTFNGIEVNGFRIAHNANGDWYIYLVDNDEREIDGSYLKPAYKVGEVVAIAQNYKDANVTLLDYLKATDNKGKGYDKGCSNKEFVKADLMPHHIRITNIKVERLQDISDEDCISEGVLFYNNRYWTQGLKRGCTSEIPQVPFRYVIDKISGNGTWNSNPYVFVYEFELIN